LPQSVQLVHCGRHTGYFTDMKNMHKRHCVYFQSENGSHSNSHWLQFPRNNNTFCGMQYNPNPIPK